MNRRIRVSALMLSSAIFAGCLSSGLASAAQEKISVAKEKTETVYVQADADGDVQGITVRSELEPESGSTQICDYSELTDIKNIRGEETFNQQNDGTILWENLGANIEYEGKTDKELPLSVEVHYYLDDKEYEPEELIGKSGRLRVRYIYINNTLETVTVDGKQVQVPVPFTVYNSIFLPTDVFKNVEIQNGSLMDLGEQSLIMGFALPGMGDTLRLDSVGLTKELKIPDYVEFTADVTDFKIPASSSAAMCGALQKFDLSEIDNEDSLSAMIKELLTASQQLTQGASSLANGMGTLKVTLLNVADDASNKISDVREDADSLMGDLDKLSAKKAAMEKTANELFASLNAANKKLNEFEIPTSESFDAEPAEEAAVKLEEDAIQLQQALEEAQAKVDEVSDFIALIPTYVEGVQSAANQIDSALSQIDLSAIESAANERARSQAENAVYDALSNTELTDEEKIQVTQLVSNSIDVSGVSSSTQMQIAKIQFAVTALTALGDVDIPDISFDTEEITALLTDMKAQSVVLEGYSDKLSGLGALLDSANAFVAEMKGTIATMQKKGDSLMSGLDYADQIIEKARKYADKFEGEAATMEDQLSNLANNKDLNSLVDGAEELSEGMSTFDDAVRNEVEGITENSIMGIVSRFKAMQEAESVYTNFGGISDGTEGNVRFIIKTAGSTSEE